MKGEKGVNSFSDKGAPTSLGAPLFASEPQWIDGKLKFPSNSYLKSLAINDDNIEVEFVPRKKVALLFISINDRYWPYLSQCIKDCKKNFLPQHNVDYFVWTDYNKESTEKILSAVKELDKGMEDPATKEACSQASLQTFSNILRLHSIFQPEYAQQLFNTLQQNGLVYKTEGAKTWIESTRPLNELDYKIFNEMSISILNNSFSEMDSALKGAILSETEPVEWPAPTLMRFHLFLSKKEELKDYDYIFYMDADMRIVEKVSDEILGEGLTTAPHPGYALADNLNAPYESNPESAAFIPRLGQTSDENGKKSFRPFYAAGGFQGGEATTYIAAMEKMKSMIDNDFNKNYIARWNDESYFNRHLFDYQQKGGKINFLDVSYIYPDSLIKEYYEPKVWGKSFSPKIITLTKPFTLSVQAAEELKKITA